MLHILMVSSEYPPYVDDKSGLGTHTWTLAHALTRAGCRVLVVTYGDGEGGLKTDGDVSIFLASGGIFPDPGSSYGNRMQDINRHVTDSAARFIEETGFIPDIIHTQGSYGIYAAEALAAQFECPLIGTAHLLHERLFSVIDQPAPPYLVEFDRYLCTAADTLIAVSHFLAAQIAHCGVRGDKPIEVIHNGSHPPLYDPNDDSFRTEDFWKRLQSDSPNIVVVGRLVEQKGILPLLESAVGVIERFPHVRYLLVGSRYDPIFFTKIERFLSDHSDLKNQVTFAGSLPHQSLLSIYRSSYMAVIPSLYESFGLSAVEAMLSGIPVVASAVGGLKEVIVHNESGLLANVREERAQVHLDTRNLAELQIKLLEDPELASRLALAGRQRAARAFTDTAMAEATLDCYTRALKRRKGRTVAEALTGEQGVVAHGAPTLDLRHDQVRTNG